jgi:hypothetical protein
MSISETQENNAGLLPLMIDGRCDKFRYHGLAERHQRQYVNLAAWTATLNLLCCPAIFAQEIKVYSFLERLRLAPAVVEGTVEQVEGDTVHLTVQHTLKGSVDSSAIHVKWYSDLILGEPPLSYRPQELVLLFLSGQQDGIYGTIGRSQGKVDLRRPIAVYRTLIQQLLAFDAASDPGERTTILEDLLASPEDLSKETALELLYDEAYKVELIPERLVPPVMSLIHDSHTPIALNAIYVLGRIGDRSTIPTLTDLLRSEQILVAEAASMVLRQMTNTDFGFDAKQPKKQREETIRKIEAWWEANKDTVTIIR